MIVSAPAWAFASWIAARRVQVAPAVAHLPSPGAASTASVVSSTVNVAAAAGATASNSAATPRRKRLTGAMEGGGEDECPVRGRLSRLSEKRGAACNCAVVSGGADLTVHGPPHGGHENGRHEKLQLISSTEHWAILSASPMLQPPSRLTSQTWGFLKGATPHMRRSTVYWAMTSASPMFTTPSPFTSPHKSVVVVVLVVDVVLVVVVVGRVVVDVVL